MSGPVCIHLRIRCVYTVCSQNFKMDRVLLYKRFTRKIFYEFNFPHYTAFLSLKRSSHLFVLNHLHIKCGEICIERHRPSCMHGCALHVLTSWWEVSAAAENTAVGSAVALGDKVRRLFKKCSVLDCWWCQEQGHFLWSDGSPFLQRRSQSDVALLIRDD